MVIWVTGLASLIITPAIKGVTLGIGMLIGNIFGIDLNKCSIFQLEAILSFFMNRLEKERESLGTGMFFLSEQL